METYQQCVDEDYCLVMSHQVQGSACFADETIKISLDSDEEEVTPNVDENITLETTGKSSSQSDQKCTVDDILETRTTNNESKTVFINSHGVQLHNGEHSVPDDDVDSVVNGSAKDSVVCLSDVPALLVSSGLNQEKAQYNLNCDTSKNESDSDDSVIYNGTTLADAFENPKPKSKEGVTLGCNITCIANYEEVKSNKSATLVPASTASKDTVDEDCFIVNDKQSASATSEKSCNDCKIPELKSREFSKFDKDHCVSHTTNGLKKAGQESPTIFKGTHCVSDSHETSQISDSPMVRQNDAGFVKNPTPDANNFSLLNDDDENNTVHNLPVSHSTAMEEKNESALLKSDQISVSNELISDLQADVIATNRNAECSDNEFSKLENEPIVGAELQVDYGSSPCEPAKACRRTLHENTLQGDRVCLVNKNGSKMLESKMETANMSTEVLVSSSKQHLCDSQVDSLNSLPHTMVTHIPSPVERSPPTKSLLQMPPLCDLSFPKCSEPPISVPPVVKHKSSANSGVNSMPFLEENISVKHKPHKEDDGVSFSRVFSAFVCGCSTLPTTSLTCTQLVDAMLKAPQNVKDIPQCKAPVKNAVHPDLQQVPSISLSSKASYKAKSSQSNVREYEEFDLMSDDTEMFQQANSSSAASPKIRPILTSRALQQRKRKHGVFPIIYIGAPVSTDSQLRSQGPPATTRQPGGMTKRNAPSPTSGGLGSLQSKTFMNPVKVSVKAVKNPGSKQPPTNLTKTTSNVTFAQPDSEGPPTMVPRPVFPWTSVVSSVHDNRAPHSIAQVQVAVPMGGGAKGANSSAFDPSAVALARAHVNKVAQATWAKEGRQLYKVPFTAVAKPLFQKSVIQVGKTVSVSVPGFNSSAQGGQVAKRPGGFFSSGKGVFPAHVKTIQNVAGPTVTAPVAKAVPASLAKAVPVSVAKAVPAQTTSSTSTASRPIVPARNKANVRILPRPPVVTIKGNVDCQTLRLETVDTATGKIDGAATKTGSISVKRKAGNGNTALDPFEVNCSSAQSEAKKPRLSAGESKTSSVSNSAPPPRKVMYQWKGKPGVLVRFEDGVEQMVTRRSEVTYVDDEPIKAWKDLKPGTMVAAKFKDGHFYDAVVVMCFPEPDEANKASSGEQVIDVDACPSPKPFFRKQTIALDKLSSKPNLLTQRVPKVELEKLVISENTVSLKVESKTPPQKTAPTEEACLRRLKCSHCFLTFKSLKSFRLHQKTVCDARGLVIRELNVKTNVEFQVDESKKPPLVIDEENKAKLRVGPSPEVKRLFKRGTHFLHRWQTNKGNSRWYHGKVLRVLPSRRQAEFEVEYVDDDQDGGPYVVALGEDYPQDIRIVFR